MRKTWFVTGASGGLGHAICLAALAVGDRVVAAVRDATEVGDRLPVSEKLLIVYLDVTVPSQVDHGVAWAIGHFGGVDILVNAASHGRLGWFEATSDADIRRQFEINVFGTMNVTRAILPHMRARRSGRILTLSGLGGMVAVPTGSVYCATRFALEGWMEGLAMEVVDFGVRCTVIEAGYFPTESTQRPSSSFAASSINDYQGAARSVMKALSGHESRRSGSASRLANTVMEIARLHAPPLRFAVGSDAVNAIRGKIENMRSEYAFFENLSVSTDSSD